MRRRLPAGAHGTMIASRLRLAAALAAMATIAASCASPRGNLSGKQSPPDLPHQAPRGKEAFHATLDAAAAVAGLPSFLFRMAAFAAQGGCCSFQGAVRACSLPSRALVTSGSDAQLVSSQS